MELSDKCLDNIKTIVLVLAEALEENESLKEEEECHVEQQAKEKENE